MHQQLYIIKQGDVLFMAKHNHAVIIYALFTFLVVISIFLFLFLKNRPVEYTGSPNAIREKANDIKINGNVEVWLTTSNQKNLLSLQDPITPAGYKSPDISQGVSVINVDPEITYQQMDGFGASFTDASSWLIANVLGEDKRSQLMSRLFSYDDGIGMSFLRQPMGASDFALKMYTYDDMPDGEEDFQLKHFSINHDKKYIIPLIKNAMELNPKLKVMATPWSPPAWMKTSASLIGGTLRPDCYDAYARYFVSFIKAYEAEGIPIYAITVQNEPLYTPSEYPGMKMQPLEQARFIREFLGPYFENNGIKTKIICYDHNWDNETYPLVVLANAGNYVAGTAWHCYGGTHSAMTRVYEKYPDKGVWFTEASGGQWVPPFHDAFADQMGHIIRSTRNYAKTVVWWNIALDQDNGPTILKRSTCRGIVKIDTATREVFYNVDYYTMGHISKFVRPGAYRIYSDNYDNILETTAFKNTDEKSVVLIAHNRTINSRTLNVRYGSSAFTYSLPAKSAATFRWYTK